LSEKPDSTTAAAASAVSAASVASAASGSAATTEAAEATTTTTTTTNTTTTTTLTTTKAPSVLEETLLLLTGGVRQSSTEIYPGFSDCSPPALPEIRKGHSTFVTTGQSPKIVTCGGEVTVELLDTASCIGLDLDKNLWDENMIGNLPKPRSQQAVVSMENIGTYLIGGYTDMKRTTDFLAEGTTEWIVGPGIPVDMDRPCAVSISNQSFLTIGDTGILEYQVDFRNLTSISGWQNATEWPTLKTQDRGALACSKIGNYVVIAGGGYGSATTYERSTEVLNLSSKSIFSAGNMNSPRAFFHMATITRNGEQLILAFGGVPDNAKYNTLVTTGNYFGENSVEEFHLSNNTWTLAPTTMESPRFSMGSVTVPRQLVCPTQ